MENYITRKKKFNSKLTTIIGALLVGCTYLISNFQIIDKGMRFWLKNRIPYYARNFENMKILQ